MAKKIKRIGVLTSGGDCAGLNAVLRAITFRADHYGWQVFGIRNGTTGLINRPLQYQQMTIGSFDGSIMRSGGTMLGSTNKNSPFAFPEHDGSRTNRAKDFCQGYRELELDALIGIGGDGSMRVLNRLAEEGDIKFVGIPKTIDNDLAHTELAIGFSTALDVATEALDRLHPTAASHQRVMLLEVMGRDAGHIALSAGIAGGADVVLVPEIPYKLEHICRKINSMATRGRNFSLVVVSEAVKREDGQPVAIKDQDRMRYGGIGYYLADKISELTGAETRVVVLGHVQRGGQPVARDRILAASFGVYATDLLAQGKFGRMVAWQNRTVIDVPIKDVISQYSTIDPNGIFVRTARGLGICLGDE